MDLPALKVTARDEGALVWVRARPRAAKTRLRGVDDGALDVAVAAPPVDGEANDELVRFLSRALGASKRDVRVVRGESARHKCVYIAHISPAELRARIAALLVP